MGASHGISIRTIVGATPYIWQAAFRVRAVTEMTVDREHRFRRVSGQDQEEPIMHIRNGALALAVTAALSSQAFVASTARAGSTAQAAQGCPAVSTASRVSNIRTRRI